MGRNWLESVVGALVLVAAVWFFIFAYQQQQSGAGSGGYSVTAKFSNVGGIKAGADVRIAGISVGRVADLRLDPVSYQALVILDIAAGTEIPTDSTLAIKSESLLGGNYLSVGIGAEDRMLADGGEIRFTQPAVSLTDLIGQVIFSQSDSAK